MFDHSYNPGTLSRLLRKRDFRGLHQTYWAAFRFVTSHAAAIAAETNFGGHNPLKEFHIKQKAAYGTATLAHSLVIRKLTLNLRRVGKVRAPNRMQLIANLLHHLEEGTPYRCYRLDVKSFYESFSTDEVLSYAAQLPGLSPMSRGHLRTLLTTFKAMGKQGLPRGLPVSAVLSEIMMSKFDADVQAKPGVYFFGRFVDDIVIITNLDGTQEDFWDWIQQKLPAGLAFNETKTSVQEVGIKMPVKPGGSVLKLGVEYLGYSFSVFDPNAADLVARTGYRRVIADIAEPKIKKIKRRIAKSLLSFIQDKDSALLIDRIKFLTSNFAVVDLNTGRKTLAGIYYGYSQLTPGAKALSQLDQFLRCSVLKSKSRIGKAAVHALSSCLKRALLSHSFEKGHSDKSFINFSSARMSQIQKCWQHE